MSLPLSLTTCCCLCPPVGTGPGGRPLPPSPLAPGLQSPAARAESVQHCGPGVGVHGAGVRTFRAQRAVWVSAPGALAASVGLTPPDLICKAAAEPARITLRMLARENLQTHAFAVPLDSERLPAGDRSRSLPISQPSLPSPPRPTPQHGCGAGAGLHHQLAGGHAPPPALPRHRRLRWGLILMNRFARLT